MVRPDLLPAPDSSIGRAPGYIFRGPGSNPGLVCHYFPHPVITLVPWQTPGTDKLTPTKGKNLGYQYSRVILIKEGKCDGHTGSITGATTAPESSFFEMVEHLQIWLEI